jgi:hypothetical protein
MNDALENRTYSALQDRTQAIGIDAATRYCVFCTTSQDNAFGWKK